MRDRQKRHFFASKIIVFLLFIFFDLSSSTFVSGPIPTEKIGLHLCCPVSLGDRSLIDNVDCDQNYQTAGFGDGQSIENLNFFWKIPQALTPNNETIFYDLRYKPLTCEDGEKVQITIPSNLFGKNVTLLRNSYLQVHKEFFHHNEFCLKRFDSVSVHFEVCNSTCFAQNESRGSWRSAKSEEADEEIPRSTTCIRKCCPANKLLYYTPAPDRRLSCVPTDVSFAPKLFHNNYRPLSGPENRAVDFHVKQTKPVCPPGTGAQVLPYGFKEAKSIGHANLCFRTRKNGNVYYRNQHRKWEFTENYCMDSLANFRDGGTKMQNDLVFMTCSQPRDREKEEAASASRKLYGGLMISSSIFLLLTFIVYLLLWEQRFPHGWTTIGHSSSMLFMYIFLGTAHILPIIQGHEVVQTFSCVAVGVLAHFFFLSTFCWLTLISFDLFWTFRSFAPKSQAIRSSRWVRRFCFYTFCGWGIPTIAVIVGLTLDSLYREAECSNVVIPGYGQDNCYLDPNSLGEYFYYPAAVLLFLNLVFFGITIYKLYEYKKSTRMATSHSSLDSKRMLFKLFTKLFFVQGLTWIFEVISWLHVGVQVPWYWTILDALNVFQAFAIFVIYVCKQQTILALHKKYPCLRPLLDPLVKLCNCGQSQLDAEQTSSLNASMRASKYGRTRNTGFTKSMTSSTNDTELT